MPQAKIREAEALLKKGDGDALREGCSTLLHCIDADLGRQPVGNGAPCLNALLKRLAEDPYKCLGLERGCPPAPARNPRPLRFEALRSLDARRGGATSEARPRRSSTPSAGRRR